MCANSEFGAKFWFYLCLAVSQLLNTCKLLLRAIYSKTRLVLRGERTWCKGLITSNRLFYFFRLTIQNFLEKKTTELEINRKCYTFV